MDKYQLIPVQVEAQRVTSSNVREIAEAVFAKRFESVINFETGESKYTIVTEFSGAFDFTDGDWIIWSDNTLANMSDNAFTSMYQEVTV